MANGRTELEHGYAINLISLWPWEWSLAAAV